MKTYIGPGKQKVLVEYSDGPGHNTGGYMYSVDDGKSWYEFTKQIKKLIRGFKLRKIK